MAEAAATAPVPEEAAAAPREPLYRVRNLSVRYETRSGVVNAGPWTS